MARSKKKVLERMVKVERPLPDQAAIFTEPVIPAKPGPKRVITADKLKIGYDHPLKEITFTLRRGQKIGMIGANGTGKTTFLKTVSGILPPLSGTCLQGQGVSAGYYDQMSARTGSDQRVLEHFSKKFPLMPLQDVRKVLGRYLFSGEDAAKRLSDLSGGELSRLYLAELLQSCPNLLLLDEPTNHMDIPAKETLESAFKMYGGTMLFISHDRYFIKEIATSLLIFEEDKVLYYPFGYEHYLEALRKEKERGADQKAAILAENARIVQELHAVPDRKRMQSARLNTDQSYTDWQVQLASEALEKAAASLSLLLSERDHLPAASASEYEENCRSWKKRFEEKMSDYHDLCLVWYDKYTDYEYAFYSYRE